MLSDILIQLIVFLLPTQLGLHFWPSFARVQGVKVDYLSPTIYAIDLVILSLIILNIVPILRYLKNNLLTVIVFISFVIINIIFSLSPLNSLSWWIHSILYLLFFITLRIKKINWKQVRKPLLISIMVVVAIEIIQLCLQSSLGGIMYYLGERAFSASTSGLGRLNLLGLEVIRPMSIFSHPNSLAGYLLTVFYLFHKKDSKSWYQLIPFLGILLTFSKSATICLALLVFNIRPDILIYLSLLLTFVQPLIPNLTTSWQPVSDRLLYFSYLKKIVAENYLTGTGLGNFIPSLGNFLPGSYLTPSILQPIHNLLYLAMTEIGILGTILVTISLFKKNVRKIIFNPQIIGLIGILLFTGAFDHYSWTLPQNKLIFFFALAIMI